MINLRTPASWHKFSSAESARAFVDGYVICLEVNKSRLSKYTIFRLRRNLRKQLLNQDPMTALLSGKQPTT